MPPLLSIVIGSVFGGLIIGLAMTSRDKWKKGRGLMAKPAKQAEENKKKMEAAKAERAKGRREVVSAVVLLVVLLVATFLLGFILFALLGT
jgi:hypothetical protein